MPSIISLFIYSLSLVKNTHIFLLQKQKNRKMCLPLGGEDEGRDLMGNLVPPNQKARDLKSTLEIILGVHFFVAIVKMIILGIFSGISDLFSCIILWCGLCRFDYCNLLIYIILTLFDAF